MALKIRLPLIFIFGIITVSYFLKSLILPSKNNLECDIKQTTLPPHLLGNDTLYRIGMRTNTDKVTYHRYDVMYERYFREYRGQHIILLEIGLGCGTATVGASAAMWRAYFGPQAEIHIVEHDRACASNWSNVIGKNLNIPVYYGSQDDPIFLNEVINRVKQNRFDIIIDDGGHTMNQQLVSLKTLLSSVRPNGLYVIEDLETSFISEFEGDPSGTANHTTLAMLKYMIDDFQDSKPGSKWNSHLIKYIYSFDIGPGIVFFRIKSDIP